MLIKTKIALLLTLHLFSSIISTYNTEINNIETKNSYEKTIEIDNINEVFINALDNNYKDKTITCIGDSITYGNGGSLKEDGSQVSYCDFLQKYLDANVVNLGIGGTAIGDYWDENSFILRYKSIPKESDVIIIFGGVNDYFIGNFGDIDKREDKTFTGDCFNLFKNIKENYPNSKIYVVLTYNNEFANNEQFKQNNFEQFMNAEKIFAKELNLDIIDLYSINFLNSNDKDIKEFFIPDGIHPNDAGSEILAKEIIVQLLLNNLQ